VAARTLGLALITIATWVTGFRTTIPRRSADDGFAPITFERHMTDDRKTSGSPAQARSGINTSPRFAGIDRTSLTVVELSLSRAADLVRESDARE
jgi:hypothetical protein